MILQKTCYTVECDFCRTCGPLVRDFEMAADMALMHGWHIVRLLDQPERRKGGYDICPECYGRLLNIIVDKEAERAVRYHEMD